VYYSRAVVSSPSFVVGRSLVPVSPASRLPLSGRSINLHRLVEARNASANSCCCSAVSSGLAPGRSRRWSVIPASLAAFGPTDNFANPSRGVAEQFSDVLWRLSLLHLPHHVPMGSLYWVFRLPKALVQHLCCHFGFHFNSLYHTSSIYYLKGVHIKKGSALMAVMSIMLAVAAHSLKHERRTMIPARIPTPTRV
jgi:hypothetical protein